MNKVYHQTVKKVTDDYETLGFNTAISQMMVFINEGYKSEALNIDHIRGFVKLLNPIAPHITEEIWEKLGGTDTITYEAWPEYDESKLVDNEVEIVIQVNGKVKQKAMIAKDMDRRDMETFALSLEAVQAAIEEKTVRKVIAVPNKLVNIVAN